MWPAAYSSRVRTSTRYTVSAAARAISGSRSPTSSICTPSSAATRAAKASAFARPSARGRGQVHAVGAALELEPGQEPAGRPVAQAQDIGQRHPLEHARADDAARAPGAVHHHGGAGVLAHEVVDAQGELAPGRAAAPGDAEAPVLLRRARVDDEELVAAALAARQLVRVDGGHVVLHLHLLAEVLAGHVHAPLGGMVEAGPAIDAALQHRHAACSPCAPASGRPGPRAGHCRRTARPGRRGTERAGPCALRAGGAARSCDPGMCARLYSPCSRTSISASAAPVSSRWARVAGAISRVMVVLSASAVVVLAERVVSGAAASRAPQSASGWSGRW